MANPISLLTKPLASYPAGDDFVYIHGAALGVRRLDAKWFGRGRSFTVAELAALDSDARLALGVVPGVIVPCSDCLTPSGVAAHPVSWDGAKWRLVGLGIEATTDRLTFCRSWARDNGTPLNAVGLLTRSPNVTFGTSTQNSGSAGVVVNGKGFTQRLGTGSASATGGARIFTSSPGVGASQSQFFYRRANIWVSAKSSSAQEYSSIWGIGNAAYALAADFAGIVLDRGNTLGINAGNSTNIIALSRSGSVNTPVVSAVDIGTSDTASAVVEVFITAANLQVIINGTSVINLTSGFSINALTAGFEAGWILKSVGTTDCGVLWGHDCAILGYASSF